MITLQSGHAQMLFLQAEDRKKTFSCTSIPRAAPSPRLCDYDTMQFVKPERGHHLRRPGCFHRGGAFGGRIAKKAVCVAQMLAS